MRNRQSTPKLKPAETRDESTGNADVSSPIVVDQTKQPGVRRRLDAEPHPINNQQVSLSAATESTVGVLADSKTELMEFVYQNGQCFDSYLATEPGRFNFRSQNAPGLVSYTRYGRFVLVGGGLIAADGHRANLLREFVEFASRQKWKVAFHNIAEDDLPSFHELGFQITKWGEEPIVDLEGCTWSGKAFEWLRRQTNFCTRQGFEAFEVFPDALTDEQWSRTRNELLEVSAESLSTKTQGDSMRFFEGRIDNHEIGRRRLFVARDAFGAGRMEAFLVCNPLRGGTEWSTEIYRRRLDSVRGAMPFLIHFALRRMQTNGISRVRLCLNPASNCGTAIAGDSPLVRLGLTYGSRLMNPLFDVAGLQHFKSRFRPRYENRYICSLPKVSLGALWAFARVSGLFSVRPLKLARNCWHHMWNHSARHSMITGH